jgi:hypothetical protein
MEGDTLGLMEGDTLGLALGLKLGLLDQDGLPDQLVLGLALGSPVASSMSLIISSTTSSRSTGNITSSII